MKFHTQAGRRIFFEPNMSHITKVSRKQPRTEDFFSRMLHPGVTCDQAIKPTRGVPPGYPGDPGGPRGTPGEPRGTPWNPGETQGTRFF